MAHGGKAALLGVHAALHELFGGVAVDVVVDTRLVPALAAQQLVERHAEVLAGDVPERDIDGADRPHDRRAAEVKGAVHILPVMLDP